MAHALTSQNRDISGLDIRVRLEGAVKRMLLVCLVAAAVHAAPCPSDVASVPSTVTAISGNKTVIATAAREYGSGNITVALFDASLHPTNSATIASTSTRIIQLLPSGSGFAIFYERDTRLLMRLIAADGTLQSEKTIAINDAASAAGPNFAVAADPSRNGFLVLSAKSATSGLFLRRINTLGGIDAVETQVTSDAGPYTALSVAATASGVAGAIWATASSPLRLLAIAPDHAQFVTMTGGAPALIAASASSERFLIVSVSEPDRIIHKTLFDTTAGIIESPTPVIYPAYSNLTPLSLAWSSLDERFVLLYSVGEGVVRLNRSDADYARELTDEMVPASTAGGSAGIAALNERYVFSDGAALLRSYCPLRINVATIPRTVALNGTLNFSASGEHGMPPYHYQWLFYDDNGLTEDATATHTFRTVGLTTVSIAVLDANENWEWRDFLIQVVPPKRRAVR